ncbi:MAG: TolC family protein [Gemmatimonadota bacterium]|nr:TolC family protein [Gemmatimonadota bacterium]
MNRPRGCDLLTWLICAATLSASPLLAQDREPLLTVQHAVELSLASYPSIGAARARVDEAQARVGQATSRWWPALSMEASSFRHAEPMLVYPLHGFDTSAFQFDRTLLQGNVTAGWTLFDGGGRGARIRAARADEAAVTSAGTASEMDVVLNVVAAYLTVRSAHETLDAELQSLTALTAERDRVQRLRDEGQAADVELLRVAAALAQAESERVSTAASLDVAERSLARWLGLDVDRTRAAHLGTVSLKDSVAADVRDHLTARFEAANPELLAARQQREAAEWSRRAAIGAWFPQLDLVGRYLLFSGPEFDVQGEWQAGVRLSYPLFTGGARASAVSATAARAVAAAEQERLLALRGADALDRALSTVQETRARAAAVGTAVAHLTEVARIEQLALQEGAGTQTDFLRADADLRRTRAALVRARHAEIIARVQLARITGDLTVAWLAATLETSP